jgi:cytochrome c553
MKARLMDIFKPDRLPAKRLPAGCRLLLVLCCLGTPIPALAGDAAAGKAKAQICTVCHGPMGLGQMPNAPNLAGQPEGYLIEQLKHFRNGKRQNEVMAVIAKNLTDSEIDDLATWFSSIQIGLK